MPTPLAYRGLLYVLANCGVFDDYDLATGKENYRQRLPLVEAGAEFKHISTNSIGETVMATPAISDGVMYVRGASTLFAIGRR